MVQRISIAVKAERGRGVTGVSVSPRLYQFVREFSWLRRQKDFVEIVSVWPISCACRGFQ
jgi:hypothetical protein